MFLQPSGSPDCAQLSAIHRQCFAGGWDAPAFAGLLGVHGTLAFIAPEHAGFGILRLLGNEAEIITLAVLPSCRRSGIGRAIALSMLQYAKAQGVTSVFLEVRESNQAARVLYQEAGFSMISRRKQYYAKNDDGPQEDAIVMRRTM